MHLWLIQTRVQGLQIDLFKISRHLCFKNGINTVSWCLVFLSEAKKRHLLLTCPFQLLTCSICSGWRYLKNLYSQTETVNEVHPLVCIPSFVLPNVSSPHNKPCFCCDSHARFSESQQRALVLLCCCFDVVVRGKKFPVAVEPVSTLLDEALDVQRKREWNQRTGRRARWGWMPDCYGLWQFDAEFNRKWINSNSLSESSSKHLSWMPLWNIVIKKGGRC